MAELTTPVKTFHEDFFRPGQQVWFRARQLNDKGKVVEMLYGLSGDLTYQGYTTFGNAVYLIFDRTEGAGKKAKMEQFAVNAFHCQHIGPYIG